VLTGWAWLGGFAAGGLLVGALSYWQARRWLARAQEAERRARSAERLAEVGAMTGGLAHEIKNPLSTIGLNAQLLAEGLDELNGVDPDSKQRLTRRLSSLRREVERLRGILSDFLNFAGEIRLDLHDADLNRVIDELCDFFLPQAQQQGVQLRTDLSPTPLTGRIDAPQFKQAVLNLLLNAVQAMPPGKPGPRELILRTSREADAQGRPVNVLHVIDTGPGIDPQVLPRIFTPYFTTKSGGTGLGLPTARRLIEAHAGRIDVHTELGRGTDFAIHLPASDPARP
jgi:signal transduction histidine kinase